MSDIRGKFRRHRKKDDSQAKSKRATAYSSLCTMRQANSGGYKAMEKLILKSFGRKGARRRQLVSSFVYTKTVPTDTKALEALLDGKSIKQAKGSTSSADKGDKPTEGAESTEGIKSETSIERDKSAEGAKSTEGEDAVSTSPPPEKPFKRPAEFYKEWETSKLRRLLESQKEARARNPLIWETSTIKGLNPDQHVPKETMWGKPPGEKLIDTKRASWYRRAANRVMPPLQQSEWDFLRQLAEGAQDLAEWKVPERRPVARLLNGTDEQGNWDWKSYVSKPVNVAEKARSLQTTLRTGQKDPGPFAPRVQTKDLSPRWYQRMYMRVWQITPRMVQDPKNLKPSFEWGKRKSTVAAPTKIQLDVFEGVDATSGELQR